VAVIVASGPSLRKIDLQLARGRAKVLAIKQNVDICPWADVVYGCDAAWWKHRRGLPEYTGLKMCWAGNEVAREYPGLVGVTIKPAKKGPDYSDQLQFDGTVGGGGNSGFQALNLVAQFGAPFIILTGLDLNDRNGAHWYGRNNWSMANNPTPGNFQRWLKAFEMAAPVLADRGFTVVNASPASDLKAFPTKPFAQALDEFTAACEAINLDRV